MKYIAITTLLALTSCKKVYTCNCYKDEQLQITLGSVDDKNGCKQYSQPNIYECVAEPK